MANKVNVVINGEIITLKSSEDNDYLQGLARYIDQKLDELKSHNAAVAINERIRTLLIALNVADDYHKEVAKLKTLQAEHERFIAEMGRMQEENKLLQEKLQTLQGDLARAQENAKSAKAKTEKNENILTMPSPEGRKAAK